MHADARLVERMLYALQAIMHQDVNAYLDMKDVIPRMMAAMEVSVLVA